MVDKKEDEKEKNPFSDSSEIFESIFKEATQEIQKETGKVVPKPGVKAKPKPEIKPKPEPKPKAPIKLELEPEPQPKVEPEQKPRSEAKPRIQPPVFKPRQEPMRRPITRTSGLGGQEAEEDLLSTHPLISSPVQKKKSKEKPGEKIKKPELPKKKGKGSPVIKIILLLVLLAAGVVGASVYLGIIDVSNYIGWPEPAKKEAPKVAAKKTPPAQTAAKPAQQQAPKPAQPSKPPTKAAEAPKPPARPQTAQPPQAPPKPAEAVKPSPPPPPPEVQAKPAPPAPPAVAKAETPAPAVQPPVKVEPPPAPVQPPEKSLPAVPPPPVQAPVKSLPQAPPPPVQPPVKSEPKAPAAPVQPPAVPKKVETPQTASQPKEVVSGSGVSYPFSVYLGSLQTMEYVKKAMSSYESQGLSIYWSKVELGAKGTWYRVFTGHFRSAQEAEAFIQQKRIKDAEVKETRYSNLIGTFGTKQGGEEKALALARMGLSAYWIQGADGQVRLYSGAFITREGAEKNHAELNSKGIKSEIVER
jgi:hypothetical protein